MDDEERFSPRGDVKMSNHDGSKGASRLRLAVAAIVSLGLLVPLAAFGAGNSGQTSSAAQYKITICHHTHSKKHPFHTIRISNKAWPAHQRHGDTLGPCPTSKTKSNHGKSHQNSKPQTPAKPHTPAQPQSPSHANEHANDHAKTHGK